MHMFFTSQVTTRAALRAFCGPTAGVRAGGWFHLGVAAAMLVAVPYLLRAGPGSRALDARFAT